MAERAVLLQGDSPRSSSNIAILEASFHLPIGAVAAPLSASRVAVGERVWSVGFPEQIPSLLTQGTIAASLSKVYINNMPPGFDAHLLALSGAISPGSAGSGVFDEQGHLLAMVIADATYFDGGFAVPASTFAALDSDERPR